MTLKEKYKECCKKYIEQFCKKQNIEFDGWIGNNVGGVAVCSDYYLSFNDIVWDINSKQRKGVILNWYNDNLDGPEKSINYFSYTKGLRIKDV